jgi:hypothetical protein
MSSGRRMGRCNPLNFVVKDSDSARIEGAVGAAGDPAGLNGRRSVRAAACWLLIHESLPDAPGPLRTAAAFLIAMIAADGGRSRCEESGE